MVDIILTQQVSRIQLLCLIIQWSRLIETTSPGYRENNNNRGQMIMFPPDFIKHYTDHKQFRSYFKPTFLKYAISKTKSKTRLTSNARLEWKALKVNIYPAIRAILGACLSSSWCSKAKTNINNTTQSACKHMFN